MDDDRVVALLVSAFVAVLVLVFAAVPLDFILRPPPLLALLTWTGTHLTPVVVVLAASFLLLIVLQIAALFAYQRRQEEQEMHARDAEDRGSLFGEYWRFGESRWPSGLASADPDAAERPRRGGRRSLGRTQGY
jgi:hypothetical protein